MKEEKIKITSRKKWLALAIAIALLNPVFSGLIIGFAFLSEPELKKEGKIVLAITVVWGILFLYLINWLTSQGYLPNY